MSFALRGQGRMAPETRRRIIETAQRLGYRPNSIARTMRSGRFSAAALLLPEGAGGYLPPGMIRGVTHALAASDMHLNVAELPNEKLTNDGFVPKILRELCVDGLLLDFIAGIPQRMIDLIKAFSIPSVWLNSKQPFDCVYPDDHGAAATITRHLLERGHRRIAYLGPVSPHYSTIDRRLGYEQAMSEAGLAAQSVIIPRTGNNQNSPPLAEACAAMLSAPDRPTAVVTYTPVFFDQAYVSALRLGLSVPRDLSLTTFDSGTHHFDGQVATTMAFQQHVLGETAVRLLLQRIATPEAAVPAEAIAFRVVEGQTCISIQNDDGQ